jgi:plastocyanin
VTVDSARLKSVRPYWVSIVPCGADPQYSVPGDGKQGATDTRHRRWSVPITGRIVAVGGHLHGGARRLRLSQPRCHRTLVTSKPTYGQPDDPVYQVKPLLHAPDPLNITWWQSKTGIPVLKGETLTVASDYDGQFPQLRVMGIDHIYIASDSKARHDCAPLPADAQELGPDWVGRPAPPHVELTLAQVGPDGYAHPIEAPPGKIVAYKGTASVKEYQYGFHPANIAVNRGAKVRWTFKDPDEHDVTLNNGPIGFGSPWSRSGDVYERRFDVPGTYRLYCSLHPAEMSQVVRVGSKG